MNWVDILTLLLVGGFFIYGVARGFVLQLMGLTVLVGSIVLAAILSRPAGRWILSKWPALTEDVARWTALFTIAILGLLVGSGLSHLLRSGLEKARLLAHDRLLGGLLGTLKGAVLVVFLLQATLNLTLKEGQKPTGLLAAITASRSADVASWTTRRVLVFLPEGAADFVREHDRLNQEPEKRQEDQPEGQPNGQPKGQPEGQPEGGGEPTKPERG